MESQLSNTDIPSRQSVYLNYTGVVDMTPALGAILSGQSDNTVTPYGSSCMSSNFCVN
jgi:hypothetical protein